MMKELLKVIYTRRSIRAFLPDTIPDTTIDTLLTTAISAPSAGNVQPWFFYAVKNVDLKKKLVESALQQSFIAQAPVVFVVCADLDRVRSAYGARGAALYCIQDTAAAIQNLLLASHALDLGACWIGAFSEDMVSKLLRLPASHRPVALVPVGKPDQTAPHPGRRELAEVLSIIA